MAAIRIALTSASLGSEQGSERRWFLGRRITVVYRNRRRVIGHRLQRQWHGERHPALGAGDQRLPDPLRVKQAVGFFWLRAFYPALQVPLGIGQMCKCPFPEGVLENLVQSGRDLFNLRIQRFDERNSAISRSAIYFSRLSSTSSSSSPAALSPARRVSAQRS